MTGGSTEHRVYGQSQECQETEKKSELKPGRGQLDEGRADVVKQHLSMINRSQSDHVYIKTTHKQRDISDDYLSVWVFTVFL